MDYDMRLPAIPEHFTNDRVHFFKYTTAETAKIVLTNRTLRWSTPAWLNDPLDMQFDLQLPPNMEDVRPAVLDRLWELYSGDRQIPAGNVLGTLFEMLRVAPVRFTRDELERQLGGPLTESLRIVAETLPEANATAEAGMRRNKILSLTSRPDHPVMWAHYANGSRGVVLRFRSIAAFDTPTGVAKPVNYADVIPPLLSREELIDVLAGLGSLEAHQIFDKFVYTKSSEWSYENEWRICTWTGRDPNAPYEDCQFGQHELDGIIFGQRSSPEDRKAIIDLSRTYPNVELFEVPTQRHSFSLNIIPLLEDCL